jgi:mannose-6-phosphate isomerase-like protein (cupin superfamily)
MIDSSAASSQPDPPALEHLVAPWVNGSERLWAGVVSLAPGASTRAHALDGVEAIHYTVAGSGTERVADREVATEPGSCVLIPPGAQHQVINTGERTLVVLSVTTPPIPRPDGA